ncbi:NAD(P)-dependent oxidoreductase [Streptomyces decoyicus]|uniref:NAD(P)-dependent oxidoreductase n=1 Tax=Streptomyces decoyicus TaxID=249567 RepID=UPI0033A953CF
MHLTVLAASGATGRELTRQALDRGHTVMALARNPERIAVSDSPLLSKVAADVRDRASMEAALEGSHVVLSGLGVPQGDQPGILTLGAHTVIAAEPQRIIWLGAFGTGASAQAAGWATRKLVTTFLRSELTDKVTADTAILDAGGTVFHPGPLTSGALSSTRRTVELAAVPRRFLPPRISRATVAAAMLDEAQTPRYAGSTAVPLER